MLKINILFSVFVTYSLSGMNPQGMNRQDAQPLLAQPPLLAAVQRGDRNEVTALIQRGAVLTAVDDNGYNALHVAACNGQTEIAADLIGYGLSLSSQTNLKETPLHLASQNGNAFTVQLLVSKIGQYSDINSYDHNDYSPLHKAIISGYTGIACFLLRYRANVNTYTTNFLSPLSSAIDCNNYDLVKVLVLLGANVNFKTIKQASPLFRAIKKDRADIAQFLIENGADVNETTNNGWTPLKEACERRMNDLIQLLVEKNAGTTKPADPKIMYCDELQLHEIVLFDKEKEVKDFLANYSSQASSREEKLQRKNDKTLTTNINCRDDYGETPLHKAIDTLSLSMAQLLLDHGADINAQDNLGRTPLHKAYQYAQTNMGKLLISNGADKQITDTMGKTAHYYLTTCVKNFPNIPITAQIAAIVAPKKRVLVDEPTSSKKRPLCPTGCTDELEKKARTAHQ